MKVPKWLTLSFVGLPIAAMSAIDAQSGINASDVKQADIQLFKVDDILTISPIVTLKKGDRISTHVELVVEKKGPSGTIATRQTGKINAGQTEASAIARVQIKVTNEDAITATLTVRSGDHIVAERKRIWSGGMTTALH
nr:curli-like amyloid fiber formation chaperone CsgH [uncultured Cohaesibacter sp.]